MGGAGGVGGEVRWVRDGVCVGGLIARLLCLFSA